MNLKRSDYVHIEVESIETLRNTINMPPPPGPNFNHPSAKHIWSTRKQLSLKKNPFIRWHSFLNVFRNLIKISYSEKKTNPFYTLAKYSYLSIGDDVLSGAS